MSYTTLYGIPQGKAQSVLNLLRESLIAEIIAINGYRTHIAMSTLKDLNEVLHHIMMEEKEHYNLFMDLVRKYDPTQYKYHKEAIEEIKITDANKLPDCYLNLNDCILNLVREDLKGEYEAIIQYEYNVSFITTPDIKQIYDYVIADEKEHTELLNQTLLLYEKKGM